MLLRLHESGQLPNNKNYRVYLPKWSAQEPPMVIVWAAVTADGRFPPVFIDRGVKVNTEFYRENVLKAVLKPWADKHFGHRP